MVCLAAQVSAVVRRIVPHERADAADECGRGIARGEGGRGEGWGIVRRDGGRGGGWPGALRRARVSPSSIYDVLMMAGGGLWREIYILVAS